MSEKMKAILIVGMTGSFFGSNMAEPVRAEVVRIWSDTCVNLETEGGTLFTSVLVVDESSEARPTGYYFVPDAAQAPAPDTAPRVTPADVNNEIVSEHYFTARDGCEGACGGGGTYPVGLGLLTFCVLTLRNGFTVTGESACVSPENFDAAIGRMVAHDKAVEKIWPLLGYALKQQLHESA